jgi:hypothetical protein
MPDCPPCILVILQGGGCQAEAKKLAQLISTSCELSDYVRGLPDFDPADLQPLVGFHTNHLAKLKQATEDIDQLNKALALKYQ